ncbi:MAG: CPBP family intramembrane metalloprotease [Caulobacteraceae bacterium]|nr:CPBP family intramembrane metalloprotease [Caulobacter sp.]
MTRPGWRSPSCWLALLLLASAWFWLPALEDVVYAPLAHALGSHMIVRGELSLSGYAALMVVRASLDFVLLAAIMMLLRRSVFAFPLRDRRFTTRLLLGLITGLVVMIAAILAIVGCGAARVAASAQPAWSAVAHGLGWMVFDLLGAAGEEMYGRGAVLLVAAAFLGWRGALLVSGLVFAAIHLGNPGASPVWLARLFLQGVLLAYAVFRTGSLWWSIGYHAGWNWASAPLFGAAGSGYLDAGHIFDFAPRGPVLITGGAVGPEGGVFAFLAVLAATALLVLTVRRSALAGGRASWSR